jgi:hypothetical protein
VVTVAVDIENLRLWVALPPVQRDCCGDRVEVDLVLVLVLVGYTGADIA